MIKAYSGTITDKQECVIFVRATDTLNDGTCFLPSIVGLLACARLLCVRICIHGHDLGLDVVLNAFEGLPRSCIVCIDKRFLPIDCLDKVFFVVAYHVCT